MEQKKENMKKNSNNLVDGLSFVAVIIIALLIAVECLLPIIGIEISGTLFNFLITLKNLLIIIVAGARGFNFISGKPKWVKWLFWIAIIIILVATILMWI